MKPATPPAESALGQTLAWLRSLPRPRLFRLREAIVAADRESLRADAVAGARLALLAFPLALVLPTLAGLPVWCGLAAAGIAAVVAPIVSGTATLSVGPSRATAALLVGVFAAAGAGSPETRVALLPTLLLMTGGFLALVAWLRLGAVADYVPRAVVVALLAAAAIRIALLQLPMALGIAVEPSANPFEALWRLLTAGRELLNLDLLAGLVAAALFTLARRRHGAGTAILVAVGVTAFLAMIGENVALSQGYAPRHDLVRYVGEAARLPGQLAPGFSIHGFSVLFSPALALALLIVVETTARARAAREAGAPASDIHQEILAAGAANLACAACAALPASGTRATPAQPGGARSGLASVAAGILLIAAASLLAGIVAKVPLAALAAVVLAAEWEQLRPAGIRLLLGADAPRRAAFAVTLLAGLIAPLDIALYLGMAVAIGFHLRQTQGADPHPAPAESAAEGREDWQA